METVITLPALGDNLIHLYRYGPGRCLVVDPTDGLSVLGILHKQNLTLDMILITHHHGDHTAGVAELKKKL